MTECYIFPNNHKKKSESDNDFDIKFRLLKSFNECFFFFFYGVELNLKCVGSRRVKIQLTVEVNGVKQVSDNRSVVVL